MCKQGCGHMRKYPSWKDLQKIAKMGRYAAGDGLYMQVASGGTRSWIFRYRTGDKSFHLGLGSCRYLSLPEARQRAIDLQRQRLSGLDPMEEKRKVQRPAPTPTRPSITFREAALRFIAEREASWRNGGSAYQWRKSLENYVFPTFGDESVADVTTLYVLTALQPIWATIPETARRARNRVELIMSYAIAHGWHVGNNPAAWQILNERQGREAAPRRCALYGGACVDDAPAPGRQHCIQGTSTHHSDGRPSRRGMRCPMGRG